MIVGGPAIPAAGGPEIVDRQEPEDHELIQRVALHDQDALEDLYARYATRVYSLDRPS